METIIDAAFVRRPILLRPDNFTVSQKTPWAGTRIAATYKSFLFPGASKPAIGESWEFSCDPAAPSALLDAPGTLPDLVKAFPVGILSEALANKEKSPSCEILLKIINAAEPLSFQVHPKDGDANLKSGECGKPESWLILDSEPGAGIYLGFSRSFSRDFLKILLRSGRNLKPFLNFVPVKPGDYFDIEPGVPHAIGPGVTLLEPQRILSGKSGKTYRIWDWGRRYDSHGNPAKDGGGQSRPMHLEAALEIIDPTRQVGKKFSDKCRRHGIERDFGSGLVVTEFPGNGYYQLHRFSFAGPAKLNTDIRDGYGVLTCLHGEVFITTRDKWVVRVPAGHTALIPAAALPVDVAAERPTDATIVVPGSSALLTL